MNNLYEQKYKEALEKAREIYKEDFKAMWLENLFPELKESEDEKIRKQILSFLKEFECDHYRNLDFSSWIAWLEKQGECVIDCPQNHQDSNRPSGGIVLEDFNGGEGFYKLNLAYLNKKQVEEVEEMVREWNNEPSTSEEDIKDCIGLCLTDADEQRFKNYHTNLRDCLAWLEKQGEQILANSAKTCKIELKFKIGDWVIDKQGIVHQIANVIENMTTHTYGYDIVGGGYFNDEAEGVRLWTIQDAKDGDVIVCDSKHGRQQIGIVKRYVEKYGMCFVAHCFIDWDGIFRVSEYMGSQNIHPATKEQRDTLFAKMKEAGYEWDDIDKKVLKID